MRTEKEQLEDVFSSLHFPWCATFSFVQLSFIKKKKKVLTAFFVTGTDPGIGDEQ